MEPGPSENNRWGREGEEKTDVGGMPYNNPPARVANESHGPSGTAALPEEASLCSGVT